MRSSLACFWCLPQLRWRTLQTVPREIARPLAGTAPLQVEVTTLRRNVVAPQMIATDPPQTMTTRVLMGKTRLNAETIPHRTATHPLPAGAVAVTAPHVAMTRQQARLLTQRTNPPSARLQCDRRKTSPQLDPPLLPRRPQVAEKGPGAEVTAGEAATLMVIELASRQRCHPPPPVPLCCADLYSFWHEPSSARGRRAAAAAVPQFAQ